MIVVLFTKKIMYAYKPVPVINLSPVRFIGSLTKQGIKENIQGAWYTERLVALISTVGVPVEEVLYDIVI